MALTYGAFVVQMVRDLEDPDEVSTKLESMCVRAAAAAGHLLAPLTPGPVAPAPAHRAHSGASIGIRIVDEFLAKNPDVRCRSFQDSMATLGEVRLLPPHRPIARIAAQWVPDPDVLWRCARAASVTHVSGRLWRRRGMERGQVGLHPHSAVKPARTCVYAKPRCISVPIAPPGRDARGCQRLLAEASPELTRARLVRAMVPPQYSLSSPRAWSACSTARCCAGRCGGRWKGWGTRCTAASPRTPRAATRARSCGWRCWR